MEDRHLGKVCQIYQMVTICPYYWHPQYEKSHWLEYLMGLFVSASGGKKIDHSIEDASCLHIHFVLEKGYNKSNKEVQSLIHKKAGKRKCRHSICCDIIEDHSPSRFIKYINKHTM